MPSHDGEEVWFADSGDSTVSVLSWRDGVIRSIPTYFRKFPVPDSLKTAYLNADDVSGRDDNQVRRIRSRRADLPFPDSMPPLLRILPDPAGGVWIWGRSPDGFRLRHIGMTRELLASFEVESSFEPFVIRDNLIFGVHTGPLDVKSIGVYATKQAGENGGNDGMPGAIP